ncbi:hypothetical protein ZWY2020_056120 [Hordeum vulgare]|nr:hypothetical protein ZWY2020_056120 [Hordeum vulgare]
MELAARTAGVISIQIVGDYTNQLEVVGDGVDLVCLVKCLRKKLGCAVILQVEEVKDKKEDPEKNEGKKSPEKISWCYPGCYHQHCPPRPQVVICDESHACSIM